MYADDTTLYFDLNPGTPNFVNIINGELVKASKWLSANRLSLNVNKTKVMFFHSVRKTVAYPKLYIDNKKIERVDSFLFLGLQINHNLNWNNHICSISFKVSKIAGILHKLKYEFPTSILKSIYNTLILPHLSYFVLCWGSQTNRIHLLQDRAIRNINTANYRAHFEPILTDMSNFRQLADFRLYCLVLGHSCESSRSGLIFTSVWGGGGAGGGQSRSH